jgi:hypothetical protein
MSLLEQKIKVVEDVVVVADAVVVVDEGMVGGETIIKVAVEKEMVGEETMIKVAVEGAEVGNSRHRRRQVTQDRRAIVIPILPMVPLLYPPFILAILRWKNV